MIARRARSERDLTAALPDLLDRVAGELRAGAALNPALADAARGAALPARLAADLDRLLERAREQGLAPALSDWARERPVPALRAAAAALEVAVGAGGPAAPALEGLATALRDQHDVGQEVAALSAQARMSAIVVGAAPAVSLGLSVLADPRVAPTLVATAPGRACLASGLGLEALAIVWMRRIVRCGP